MSSPTEREPIVAIPARNEANRLPSLLNALSTQSWLKARQAPLRVVVVLNNCDVASADVVRAIAQDSVDASSDKLRAGARCTSCGSKGATIQHPGRAGNHAGFYPFPVDIDGRMRRPLSTRK